jgi:hypothetical protein
MTDAPPAAVVGRVAELDPDAGCPIEGDVEGSCVVEGGCVVGGTGGLVAATVVEVVVEVVDVGGAHGSTCCGWRSWGRRRAPGDAIPCGTEPSLVGVDVVVATDVAVGSVVVVVAALVVVAGTVEVVVAIGRDVVEEASVDDVEASIASDVAGSSGESATTGVVDVEEDVLLVVVVDADASAHAGAIAVVTASSASTTMPPPAFAVTAAVLVTVPPRSASSSVYRAGAQVRTSAGINGPVPQEIGPPSSASSTLISVSGTLPVLATVNV